MRTYTAGRIDSDNLMVIARERITGIYKGEKRVILQFDGIFDEIAALDVPEARDLIAILTKAVTFLERQPPGQP